MDDGGWAMVKLPAGPHDAGTLQNKNAVTGWADPGGGGKHKKHLRGRTQATIQPLAHILTAAPRWPLCWPRGVL